MFGPPSALAHLKTKKPASQRENLRKAGHFSARGRPVAADYDYIVLCIQAGVDLRQDREAERHQSPSTLVDRQGIICAALRLPLLDRTLKKYKKTEHTKDYFNPSAARLSCVY
jgi:hypothetical protein